MEIEQLYEFTVVAKLGSFSQAAEELNMSQSSLSKHILSLERELGAPLLIRNPRNVTLSPAGAEILPLAAQTYELLNKIHVAADQHSSRKKDRLRIASIPVMAQYNITGLLAKFQREHSNVTLEVTECEKQELLSLLEGGKCELAFSRRGLEPDEECLEYLPICRDNLVAVLSRNHPLAERKTLALRDLKGQSLLFLDKQTGFHHLYTNLCRGAGFIPRIAYTGHRPENIVALAAQNMGIALLMRRHIDYIQKPDVAVIDISPAVESSICLVRQKNLPMTDLANTFWCFVEAHRPTEPSGGRTKNKE